MFRRKMHKNERPLKGELYRYWAICLTKKKKKKKSIMESTPRKQGQASGSRFQTMKNERGPHLEH